MKTDGESQFKTSHTASIKIIPKTGLTFPGGHSLMRNAAVAQHTSSFGDFSAHFGQLSLVKREEVILLRRKGDVQRGQFLHGL